MRVIESARGFLLHLSDRVLLMQMASGRISLGPTTFAIEKIVTTKLTARTLALDPVFHVLYSVSAEIEGPSVDGGRPKLKPDSFQLSTVGRSMEKGRRSLSA